MEKSIKEKYLSSAALLLISTVIVKIIGAVYKIPLTAYIGATGRGYFSTAYNLFMPIHAITMGAFPIAVSSLVSKYLAKGNSEKSEQIRKASNRLFFIVGILGLLIMLIIAKPYSNYVASSPKCVYTILVLAPSALFSSMAASRRSFAEGHLNMVPTAVCQVTEALSKMIFGLLFARLTMGYLFSSYLDTGMVLTNKVASEAEALSIIYPLTSASAMIGVTFGSIVAYVYVCFYSRFKYPVGSNKKIANDHSMSELVRFSLPLVAATIIQSLSAFADTASIQYCLGIIPLENLKNAYYPSITMSGTKPQDTATYVFGLYSSALDFKNLVPGVTMALGVTAVPALSAAYESSTEKFSYLYSTILKYTIVLSAAGGAAISLYSYDILKLFYFSSNPDIVLGCHNLLFWFGVTMVPASLASTAVFAVQSLGYSKKLIFPFTLAALVRVIINFYLVPNQKFCLMGAVISSFVSYLVIAFSALLIIKNTTHTKISMISTYIKPILATVFAYFITEAFTSSVLSSLEWILCFILSAFTFLAVLTILLVLFGTLSPKDFKIIGIK